MFGAKGELSCADSKNLYYTNGTQLLIYQTICLATAQWSGQNDVSCFEGIEANHIFKLH